MKKELALLAAVAGAALLTACAGGGSAFGPAAQQLQTRAARGFIVLPGATATPGGFIVLPGATATPGGFIVLPGGGQDETAHTHLVPNILAPIVSKITDPASVPGLHPADLRDAYRLASINGGAGATIAIVDAYDHPFAEGDLAVYRALFGLPPCTSSNGCFRKVLAHKNTAVDAGWALEIALDLEMASAICPNCSLMLVEAKSSKLKDLADAENLAASYQPQAISNSFYVSESLLKKDYSAAFIHPGIAITAASGDGGAGATFPADVPQVTAVGGTHLARSNAARGWDETPWSGAGYGCSATYALPLWQNGGACMNRWSPDVAAVGDPATGVAVFSSVLPGTSGGWVVVGGTSVGAPIIASIYALASNGGPAAGVAFTYAHSAQLFSLGAPGAGALGLGSPNGIGAF